MKLDMGGDNGRPSVAAEQNRKRQVTLPKFTNFINFYIK